MKVLKVILTLFMLGFNNFLQSQDCINYWNFNSEVQTSYNYKNQYFAVSEGCFSKLISVSETIEVFFELIQARDYKITIGSEYTERKPIIKIYNIEDNMLLYDNTNVDTISVIEFEIEVTRKVKAVVSLQPDGTKAITDLNQYHLDILRPKILRYCTGIKLETMVTRK